MAKEIEKRRSANMLAEGVSQKQISKELGVSEQTICKWKKSPEFIDEYKLALWGKVGDAAPGAISTLIYLSTKAKSEATRLAAAKDLLDRLGFKPDESIKVNMEPVVIVNDLKE